MTLLTETPHTHFAASAFAPQPAERRGLDRDEVRLLVATPDGLSHQQFRDLPDHLRAGDVLVVNTSATVAAEVDADLDGTAGNRPLHWRTGNVSWRAAKHFSAVFLDENGPR